MTTGFKIKWILIGLFTCAWKGVLLMCYWPPDKRYLWKDNYGFTNLALERAWRRLVDPADQQHDATNIIVEWTRSNPQRATKTFCGIIGVMLILLFLAILGLSI